MKRNLESRVEILCPIEDSALREELRDILDRQLADVRLGWTMKPDGTYERDESDAAREAKGSQEFFLERARRRSQRASKFVKKIAKARLRGRK
jgi:polyphosphate kinase